MPLSIRNEKAEKLARIVAKESGENITQTIIHALEDRLEKIKGRRSIKNNFSEILELAKRCSNLTDIDKRSADEILGYNKDGY